MKLARKLVLLLLVPFVVLIVVLGVLAARSETQAYRGQVADDLRVTGEALRAATTDIWLKEGQARALRVLSLADDRLPQVDIRWVSLDPPAPTLAVPLAERDVAALLHGDQVTRVDRNPKGEGRAFVYVPMDIEGRAVGAIELSEPIDRESELIRGVIRDRLLATLVVVMAGVVLAAIVGQRAISRPVRALVEQARRVGSGDLSARLSLPQKDELGELGAEMNAMCDQIEESRANATRETQARFEALSQLRHVERLSTVGKLAAGVAHELGTPLHVISGRARMIASGKGTAASVAENATIIDGQAKRMAALIRQLLTFARPNPPEKRAVDVTRFAEEVIEMLEPLGKKAGVELVLTSSDPGVCVSADPRQLEQILTNVVMNAIHSMNARGSVEVSVRRVETTRPGEPGAAPSPFVRIDVRDQGTGIQASDLERVFEPIAASLVWAPPKAPTPPLGAGDEKAAVAASSRMVNGAHVSGS